MAAIKLLASAEPNTVVVQNDVLTVRADADGNLLLETEWVVRTWLDDADVKSQLFVITNPAVTWPDKQNCHIHNMAIRERLRVLELQLNDNRAYVVATSAEITPND